MKIVSVAGARPNFMKVAPVHKAFLKYKDKADHLICHTGQHFDENMSKIFFEDLDLPRPDFYLGVGSGTHAEQTARIMIEFEKVFIKENPDLVIVVGDVNSTLACSLTAAKMGGRIAHVEAGLRSFDRSMPEEINRQLTDTLSDLLFVSEKSGLENLKKEGISDSKVYFTGNVMIDSLRYYLPKTDGSSVLNTYGLRDDPYILVTLHRPGNVDAKDWLSSLVMFLNKVSQNRKVIFPAHPRTRKNLKKFGLQGEFAADVIISEPLGYIDFLALLKNSEIVLTDSGGIQEETTYLGIPCLTLRKNTERPITVEIGTNQVIGTDLDLAWEAVQTIWNSDKISGSIPELWDGKTSERIVDIISKHF